MNEIRAKTQGLCCSYFGKMHSILIKYVKEISERLKIKIKDMKPQSMIKDLNLYRW